MIFYATVVTVYSLLFIVLTVQLPSGSGGLPIPPASLPWQAWAFGSIVFGVYVTAGLVIPLAVLAGFLADTTWWRALAFGATTIQIFIAVGTGLASMLRAGLELMAAYGPEANTADSSPGTGKS